MAVGLIDRLISSCKVQQRTSHPPHPTTKGYSNKELQEYKYIIYGNVITQMKVIVTVALKLKVELKNKESDARAQRIALIAAGGGNVFVLLISFSLAHCRRFWFLDFLSDSWTNEIAQDIKALWLDP